jgi:AraC-like DNA-binding protein
MLGAVGMTALVVLASILYAPVRFRPVPVSLAEGLALVLASLAFATLLLRFDQELLPPEFAGGPAARRPQNPDGGGAAQMPDPDRSALARLESLMAGDEIWRETGLTIGGLAARIGMPEYRLRRLINGRLGFRNFTAYLNEYRLAAAADRLADREQARTPVLTIALDLGWGSIGPFNRSFRARFGTTPSDFRRARMGAAAAHEHRAPTE